MLFRSGGAVRCRRTVCSRPDLIQEPVKSVSHRKFSFNIRLDDPGLLHKLSKKKRVLISSPLHAAGCPSLCLDTRPWQYFVTEQVMRHLIVCMSTGCHRILVKAKFSTPVQTGPRTHPASCTVDTGAFPGVKQPGRDHHPPASRVEIQEIIELYFTPNFTILGP